MSRGDRVLPHGRRGGAAPPGQRGSVPGLSELPPLQPRPGVWQPQGHGRDTTPAWGPTGAPHAAEGMGGPQAPGLAAGGPGGRAGRDRGHPHPTLLGAAAPTPHPSPSLIIPNPHPGRRINKACLVLPGPSRPSPGPLTYSNSFHTATIPSLEGHLQELSRVGRGRGADPRQEAKQEPAHLCSG